LVDFLFGFRFWRGFTHEMKLKDGRELLAEYLSTGSETAFREVVNRYLNFVYCVALRLVEGDTLLAQDVAQTVFINLARKASGLSSAVSLGGWLHEHTYHVATKAVRSERRRQAREKQALETTLVQDNSAGNLAQVGPVLHEAIRQLGTEDRAAILLRFFEQQDFRTVGQALNTSEDAARMRVNRAVEKLQSLLKRRGVALSTAALATGLAGEGLTAAPAGLATLIAGTALASLATGGTTLSGFGLMTLTKLKLAILAAVAAGMAAWLAIELRSVSGLREENQSLQQQLGRIAQLAAENQRLSNMVVQAESAQSHSQDQLRELLRLRGEVGLLRQQSKEMAKVQHETPPEAAENSRINDLATSINTVKTAVVDHYGNFGSFPREESFELTLVREKLLENPPLWHVRIQDALSSNEEVTASNAAYNFHGDAGNETTGSFIIEAVIPNLSAEDARALSLEFDGAEFSTPLGEADLKGRVKFGAIPAEGVGEVHVYMTHH
jgi:RNA polymerase sigma factor (sigma-70 family)